MRWRREHWIGIGFWLIAVVGTIAWLSTSPPSTRSNATASPAALLVESIFTSTQTRTLVDPTRWIRNGDVVFSSTDETWREIGYVTAVNASDSDKPNHLTVTLFEPEAWTHTATFTAHRSSGRLEEVLATLLPDERREALQKKITAAFQQHADEVTAALLPLVMESLSQSVPVIENAVAGSIERHADEIRILTDRYREEIVQQKLVPLVRKEVMPIVRRHGEPPAEAIGREIWRKASLWRFGWRAVYDKTPLPERDLVQEEWRRFVDEEVMPTLEDHVNEIAVAVEMMVKDLAANERLRDELGDAITTIAADKETHQLVRVILNEAVVDNEQLTEVLKQVWTSPDAKSRLRIAGQRIEPILRDIGDEIMGTRREGIQPGFARVLRNQILGKDRSWITIEGEDGLPLVEVESQKTPTLVQANDFMPYPVVYLANGGLLGE